LDKAGCGDDEGNGDCWSNSSYRGEVSIEYSNDFENMQAKCHDAVEFSATIRPVASNKADPIGKRFVD
jgi:hypothetical protein